MEEELALLGGKPAVNVPHPPKWPQVNKETQAAINRLLERGELSDYGHGQLLTDLENAIADYHGGITYVLLTSSGTAALHSAYVGLGIEPGDEVLVPSYTFLATVTPLFLCNSIPVLCDSEPNTGNIDVNDVERKITPRTKAIAVTHLWGHPVEMDSIMKVARKHSLKVVEDCSHAHGARYHGRQVGTIGDVGIFSMGASKMVSGGMGGALMTEDVDVYERALLLGHARDRARISVISEKYKQLASMGYGANYRITPIAACICLDQFRDLDKRIAIKTHVLERLSALLSDVPNIESPITRSYVTRGGWYGYKATYVPEALKNLSLDRFLEALRAEGLQVNRPGSVPLHLLEAFQKADIGFPSYRPGRDRLLYKPGDLLGAEKYYSQAVSFPATRLHEPCDQLLEQYALGLKKVVVQYEKLLCNT